MNRNDGARGDARKRAADVLPGEQTITVSSFGMTAEAQAALFDRVADAAHALAEDICCFTAIDEATR